ncbi:TetR/AcrR family transcriptional regulator [Amycolatopsis rhabdoformis]|uniref:TetR/AcrR family transcriptional regulator n=1 Tax=Amycolatopsis rhabdoformis TaxID=1448059 RepID=A0ABZ1HYW5_9PSEU|nr:TetR/AcrR family transcriptional regulator [Amycolatopsis rhabdoformis]WSE27382.1 TetR/AcrR family transcriptional regulator [Amycolatopsis rhabdoformis]
MSSEKRTAPPRGQRRAALIEVAADLFARKPYDEIYISEIAEAAGVAHGLLFYHFKDKRGLYLAVLQQALDELVDLHRPREDELTREQRMRGLLRRHIDYRRAHVHTMLAFIRAGGQDPEVDELFERARRAGAEFVVDLLGLTTEPPPRVRVAIRGIMGLLDETTLDWLTHDCDVPAPELENLVYDAIVAILATVSSAHPELGDAVADLHAAA